MSTRAIIAIISICAAAIGSFVAVMFWMLMIEQIDRNKPDGSLYSAFGFPRLGTPGIVREYRRSHPDGSLHVYVWGALAVAMIGMVGLVGIGVYSIALTQQDVIITSPAKGATFTAPANIVISADASIGNYNVSRVDFYQGATLVGSSTTAPYNVTWTNVPEGDYSLTARATDDRGTTTDSDAVAITVRAPG